MAEVTPPLALQTAGILHPAKLFRRALAGLVQEGVCRFNTSGDLKVTSGGSMNSSIARGGCFIEGGDTTDQGLYFAYNDGAKTLTHAASNPSNPRNDLIVAKIQDNTEGVAGDTWALAIVQGTPAASPSDPATPASSITLARVLIGAGVTSFTDAQITDLRPFANSRDKITVLKTADESVTSSIAMQDDNELQFTAHPGEVWRVSSILRLFSTSSTPDFDYTFVGPSGTTGAISSGDGSGNVLALGSEGGTQIVGGTEKFFIPIGVIYVGATGGLVKLQWAQNISDAAATTVKSGSILIAERIA